MAWRTQPPTPPLANSYWVLPDRLLAGEHPGGADEAETRARLATLAAAGIDSFVDLTDGAERDRYDVLLPPQAHYFRSAIPDTEVPETPAQMVQLQTHIREALQGGRAVYVHCRAGIGRTGLVIGCFLADEGLAGRKAVQQLNRLWRQSARSASWPQVPQTAEQADYIRRWPEYRKSLLSQRIDS